MSPPGASWRTMPIFSADGIRTSPSSGCSSPAIRRSSVDLPVPLRPTSATRVAAGTCRFAPSSRGRPAMRKVTSVRSSMAAGWIAWAACASPSAATRPVARRGATGMMVDRDAAATVRSIAGGVAVQDHGRPRPRARESGRPRRAAWLTIAEAAKATGWNPERLRSLARRGTITSRRGNRGLEDPGRGRIGRVAWTAARWPIARPAAAAPPDDPDLATDLRQLGSDSRAAARRAGRVPSARRATCGSTSHEPRSGSGRWRRWRAATWRRPSGWSRPNSRPGKRCCSELRAQVGREVARGEALATELAEMRRPWWRRLLG